MINDEKLKKLYDLVISDKELVTKDIKEKCAFSQKDIAQLIKNGYLKRVKIGYYEFCNASILLAKGLEFVSRNDTISASDYFKKAYQIAYNDPNVVFQYFLFCMLTTNYDKALDLYDQLILIDLNHSYDYNYYLFLLSCIIKLPDKYQKIVNKMVYSDIKIPDSETSEHLNTLRQKAFYKKFKTVFGKITEQMQRQSVISFQDVVTKKLYLLASVSQQKKVEEHIHNREKIVFLLKQEDYQEIIKVLSEKKQKDSLSRYEVYVLQILIKMQEIQTSGLLPKVILGKSTTIFEAIDNGDYSYALCKCQEYDLIKGIDNDSNPLFLALQAICIKINEISDDIDFQVTNDNNEADQDELFVEEIYTKLVAQEGVIVLDSFSEEKTCKLLALFDYYVDIMSFTIEDNGQKRIVLRYHPLNRQSGYVTKNIYYEAINAYNVCDYEACIKSYLLLISIMNSQPDFYIYSHIGLAYLKLDNLPQAIDYLLVANSLSKQSGNVYDYTDLIESLRKKLANSEEKDALSLKLTMKNV